MARDDAAQQPRMAQKCIWQPQPLTDSQILKRSGNGLCSKHTAVAPILDVVYSINAIIQQLMTSELEGCDHYIIHNISSPVTSITTIHKTDNWSNSNSYFNHNSRFIHCWHNLFFLLPVTFRWLLTDFRQQSETSKYTETWLLSALF